MSGTIQVPFCPSLETLEHARMTLEKAESMRTSQFGLLRNLLRVLRRDRCRRKWSTFSTMRGSGAHHKMGWPALNQGNVPWAYARRK